ncbi:lysozyme-like protein [Martensiomyces pterosporus]|nr:lysozyme-like protein [Martensiomyces pterosporus]
MKFTTATLGLAATVATFSSVNAALIGCPKELALKITNIYENGDTRFHYEYCEDFKDGRGYTSGIAGFCTGTGDAWQVIQQYHGTPPKRDDFSKYDPVLKEYAAKGSPSLNNLQGYCDTWKRLGQSDKKFQAAQDTIRDNLYFSPSQKYADKLGLKFSISQAQLYDAGIQHGTGTDADGLGGLVKATNAAFTKDAPGSSGSTLTINGHKVDEVVWLQKFLNVRTADLKKPHEKENASGAWAKTLYRIKSYQHALDKKEYNWTKSVEILNNDGKVTTVSC